MHHHSSTFIQFIKAGNGAPISRGEGPKFAPVFFHHAVALAVEGVPPFDGNEEGDGFEAQNKRDLKHGDGIGFSAYLLL